MAQAVTPYVAAIDAPIEHASLRTVDGPLHDRNVVRFVRRCLAAEGADLPRLGLLGRAQASVAQRAGQAVAQGTLKLHGQIAVVLAVGAVLVEPFAGRAQAGARLGVVGGCRQTG